MDFENDFSAKARKLYYETWKFGAGAADKKIELIEQALRRAFSVGEESMREDPWAKAIIGKCNRVGWRDNEDGTKSFEVVFQVTENTNLGEIKVGVAWAERCQLLIRALPVTMKAGD